MDEAQTLTEKGCQDSSDVTFVLPTAPELKWSIYWPTDLDVKSDDGSSASPLFEELP